MADPSAGIEAVGLATITYHGSPGLASLMPNQPGHKLGTQEFLYGQLLRFTKASYTSLKHSGIALKQITLELINYC